MVLNVYNSILTSVVVSNISKWGIYEKNINNNFNADCSDVNK